jgi:hypothetical protein
MELSDQKILVVRKKTRAVPAIEIGKEKLTRAFG